MKKDGLAEFDFSVPNFQFVARVQKDKKVSKCQAQKRLFTLTFPRFVATKHYSTTETRFLVCVQKQYRN